MNKHPDEKSISMLIAKLRQNRDLTDPEFMTLIEYPEELPVSYTHLFVHFTVTAEQMAVCRVHPVDTCFLSGCRNGIDRGVRLFVGIGFA